MDTRRRRGFFAAVVASRPFAEDRPLRRQVHRLCGTDPEIPAEVLDAIATFGLGAEAADVEFSAVKFQSPWAEPGHYVAQAEAAVGTCSRTSGPAAWSKGALFLRCTGIPPARSVASAAGGLWERGMLVFAMDTLYRATGDPTISRRLKTEWAGSRGSLPPRNSRPPAARYTPHATMSGWDALYYLCSTAIRATATRWSAPRDWSTTPSGDGSTTNWEEVFGTTMSGKQNRSTRSRS